MRIIAGNLKGRVFVSPGTDRTHPMSDRARGALFNILGDIAGLRVLDPFAGTGALCFEAVSRGAVIAEAIELDRTAQNAIERNISSLGVGDRVNLVKSDAGAWLKTHASDRYDIVLCDPPYETGHEELLRRLTSSVGMGGLFVVSQPQGSGTADYNGFQLLDHRSYGDAALVFYRRVG